MELNYLKAYLSGEIHTGWRDNIKDKVLKLELPVNLLSPVTNHTVSDDCGIEILGEENKKFWHDYKGASINSIRTKSMIEKSDIVIVKFGDKYRQWNAAFDAGMAVTLGKSLITLHDESLDHALKEIDAASSAVCRNEDQVINTLKYVTSNT
ncbi:MAG: YtoQ family protein [Pseudomonadota bacterium]|nr:YtoQ family protein [Pseudomonadota bacterium]